MIKPSKKDFKFSKLVFVFSLPVKSSRSLAGVENGVIVDFKTHVVHEIFLGERRQ